MLFDGALTDLAARFNATKTIGVMLKDGTADLSAYGEVMESDDGRVLLRVARADAPDIATRMLRDLPVADLTIEDPPIDDVIETVFASARPSDDAATDDDASTEASATAR
jgi:ABC-2 type transport system ATP-binding protein